MPEGVPQRSWHGPDCRVQALRVPGKYFSESIQRCPLKQLAGQVLHSLGR